MTSIGVPSARQKAPGRVPLRWIGKRRGRRNARVAARLLWGVRVAEAPEDVFVSYSRLDNEKVHALTGKLRAAGVRLWMDVRNIDGAAMWGEEIVNAVANSKVLLLLVSKTSVTSQNV